MKKIFVFALSLSVVALVFTGCKKTAEAPADDKGLILQPKSQYTAADTLQVRQLVDSLLTVLNAHDFSKAADMVSFLDRDSIVALSKEQRQRQIGVFSAVKGIRYEPGELFFHEEKDNLAKCRIILFDREPGDNRPNEVSFGLRPVRRNGQWYLTIADDMQSTNGKSEIKN